MNKYTFNWDFRYKETADEAGEAIAYFLKSLPVSLEFEIQHAIGGLWGNPYRIRVKYQDIQDYKQELRDICKRFSVRDKSRSETEASEFEIPDLYDN